MFIMSKTNTETTLASINRLNGGYVSKVNRHKRSYPRF
jgi:hypothetical protein